MEFKFVGIRDVVFSVALGVFFLELALETSAGPLSHRRRRLAEGGESKFPPIAS